MNKYRIFKVLGFLILIAMLINVGVVIAKQKKSSGVEIERKFLIDINKIPYKLKNLEHYTFEQAYISFSPEMRIRKVDNKYFYLTVKAPIDTKGMVREEREFVTTREEYEKLLKKMEGNLIFKDRYQIRGSNYVICFDIYSGSLKGLTVMEIEFQSVKQANKYVPPAWVGKDVTSDKRYKNGNLAQDGLSRIGK